MPRMSHRVARMAGVFVGAALLTALQACYKQGGTFSSEDLFTYHSTIDTPKRITVMDLRSKTPIWTVDIPVGQQLVMDFSDNYFKNDPTYPAQMRWALMKLGKLSGQLPNSMAAPPSYARRVDVEFYEYDGMSEELDGAGVPASTNSALGWGSDPSRKTATPSTTASEEPPPENDDPYYMDDSDEPSPSPRR